MPDESQRDLPERVRSEVVADGEVVESGGTSSARLVVGQQTEVVVSQYEHSGPLPDEQWFQAVEKLHPGATEMLLTDYRDQREHSRDMERRSLALDDKNFSGFMRYQMTRLWFAGSLAALIAIAGIVLIAVGLPVVGLIFLVAEIAALVAAFFGMRRQSDLSSRDGGTADDGLPSDGGAG